MTKSNFELIITGEQLFTDIMLLR